MTRYRVLPLLLGLLGVGGLTGCGLLGGETDSPEIVASAEATARSGDLPGAIAEFKSIHQANPDSVHAAEGAAYAHLLSGNYEQADQILAAAEARAGDRLGEVKLRRAIVALRSGNLDAIKLHGKASELPAGKVLAAEVHLADAESDEAIALLRAASSAGGEVGATARAYLEMLESGDPTRAGLAEVTALWALGQRQVAVEAAVELVRALPPDDAKSELVLIWASRAVVVGRHTAAQEMLDDMGFPPDGQAWRVQATRALVAVAEEDYDRARMIFDALDQAGAPADGLADALATAAALSRDPAMAKEFAGRVESVAAARGLYAAGDVGAARQTVPSGSNFGRFLESR